ncbi:hypothetical protein PIB30_017318 [Stylosanthes scabra]|uniref:Syntaxin 6/10/61 N-terminal domain-containing protein n=1 Tax=Stylosanthes scabra TaxID=79078 RepID=A0ABU6S7G2_9FABA|nr:hypothetical protein [Stylosanthes scabra]
MASSFQPPENDPFFTAAEQLQESADRMKSAYMTWYHAMKAERIPWNSEELFHDVKLSHQRAKWQLTIFQKALTTSRYRYQDFISAIADNITKVENSLNKCFQPGTNKLLRWVRPDELGLHEGEGNELALFVSGVPQAEPTSQDALSSADAHVGSEKIIAVSDDLQQCNTPKASSGVMHKVASLFGLVSSNNGYKKLKAGNHDQESENALSPLAQSNGGLKSYCKRSKSYLDSCDECYDKQLYGWYGAIQRFQYQMQHSRPLKLTVWIVILLCMIELVKYLRCGLGILFYKECTQLLGLGLHACNMLLGCSYLFYSD